MSIGSKDHEIINRERYHLLLKAETVDSTWLMLGIDRAEPRLSLICNLKNEAIGV
ncbi:hypothetical protein [Chamaesiphon sp. OTE_8_metabat_110]|uniref:hypothetical protein n=1 Tax=Chamaesiphon sp. OTE_8_metabat_110 TaxID=2964696 RepID=UPI00286A3B54|nr:hypothetical protein [Chamaesiphon sp. OTE_8_metabat_110]